LPLLANGLPDVDVAVLGHSTGGLHRQPRGDDRRRFQTCPVATLFRDLLDGASYNVRALALSLPPGLVGLEHIAESVLELAELGHRDL